MAEVVTCPTCQRRLDVPPDLAGGPMTCPTCATSFTPVLSEPEPPTVDYQPAPDDDLELRVRRDLLPHRGTMVLVFGILGLAFMPPSLCCGAIVSLAGIGFSVTAWVLGHGDLRAMREHRMDADGMRITRAGWICGIVGAVLNTVLLLVRIAITVAWAMYNT
jgi:hypothetical protein